VGAWETFLSLLILFTAALAMGTLAEELKQYAIIGYLAAGMLVGPNVLGWVGSSETVSLFADLGVALLMFSVGLEFSIEKLIKLKQITLLGGAGQVFLTSAAAALIFRALGFDWGVSLAVGVMIAQTSTACMSRALADITQLDSLWGRSGIAISLLQDVTAIPLAVMIAAIGTGESHRDSLAAFGQAILYGALIYIVLLLLIRYVLPRFVSNRSWSSNRELPVLLAVVVAFSSAWISHRVGLSPAFGAFIAGLLLSASPYAIQIRADVSPLRSLLVTLFFASIGLMANPGWVIRNPVATFSMVAVVLLLKPLVVFGLMRALRYGYGISSATGLCHAQVGEFGLLLAGVALTSGAINLELFEFVVSVAVLTLFVNPYIVRAAPAVSRWAERTVRRMGHSTSLPDEMEWVRSGEYKKFIIIGFGPAGQRAAEKLYDRYRDDILIMDLNQRNARIAQGYGLDFVVGDARSRELLEHVHVDKAQAVLLTLPDPEACRTIIHLCKSIDTGVRVFARARYHVLQWDLMLSGAEAVVSEEDQVGMRLAEEVLSALHVEEAPNESE